MESEFAFDKAMWDGGDEDTEEANKKL